MTSHEIIKADLLDILFEGRNKQYGAYALRRYYNNRLSFSLGIMLSSCLLVFLLQPSSKENSVLDNEKDDIIVQNVIIPKVQPPAPPPPPIRRETPPPPPAASSSLTTKINLVDKPDPNKLMDEISNMKHTLIGNTNDQGPITTDIVQPPPSQPAVTTGAGSSEQPETAFKPEERAPEFPGGMQAWVNFLNKHLQTPDELEPGEKKTVLVSFMVDVDGSVTGFKVVQSGGCHFDEEVIRVLRKMPRWKPAIQNGRPATMPFTQPVTFVGIE